MKVANGMDSVFDNATQEEQEFQVMFDDDDSIIDFMAGVDEAGVPLTGPDFDWSTILSEDGVDDNFDVSDIHIPEDEKYNAEKNGDQQFTPSQANGVKDAPLAKGGELGTSAMTPGSAEAKAYDDKKEIDDAIGLTDKQQVKLEDAGEGPLEDDDEAERNGETSEYAASTESLDVDKITESILANIGARVLEEADFCPNCKSSPCTCDSCNDPISDPCDTATRNGDIKMNSNDIEGVKASVIGQALDGDDPKDDTIIDLDDIDAREGETSKDADNIEGVDTDAIGVAVESALRDLLEDEDVLAKIVDKAKVDNLTDIDDADARDGETNKDEGDNIEGVDTEGIGAAIESTLMGLMEDDDTLAKLVDKAKVDNLTDIDDSDAREGKTNKDEGKNIEGVDTEDIGAAVEAAIADLLSDVGDKDDIDIEGISDDDMIVPDDIRESFYFDEEVEVEDIDDDAEATDDIDIEMIDNDEIDAKGDVDYSYDDDELIDMVISGDM